MDPEDEITEEKNFPTIYISFVMSPILKTSCIFRLAFPSSWHSLSWWWLTITCGCATTRTGRNIDHHPWSSSQRTWIPIFVHTSYTHLLRLEEVSVQQDGMLTYYIQVFEFELCIRIHSNSNWVESFMAKIPIIQKLAHWFSDLMNWLISIW